MGYSSHLPQPSGDLHRETHCIVDAVGLIDANDFARVAVTGGDRLDYLNRRLSQKTVDMQPGDARRAAILDAVGKMVADLEIFAFPDRVVLWAPPWRAERLAAEIDKYVFTEDCQVEDIAPRTAAFLLVGPRAEAAVAGNATILRTANALDGVVAIVEESRAEETAHALLAACRAHGGDVVGRDAYHRVRVAKGRPWWGAELDESTIPLEAGLLEAVHFDKGCFPGQETIARISNLGHPARQLVRARIEGEAPAVPTILETTEGKPAGMLTSVAASLDGSKTIGLAMVKWLQRQPGTQLIAGDAKAIVE